jgi:hypothetical protein
VPAGAPAAAVAGDGFVEYPGLDYIPVDGMDAVATVRHMAVSEALGNCFANDSLHVLLVEGQFENFNIKRGLLYTALVTCCMDSCSCQ